MQQQQVEEAFRSENVAHSKAATLGLASAVTFAHTCPSDPAASIMQVEIPSLVCSLLGTARGMSL